MDINLRVARQVENLRRDRRLRIEDLAARSGVSRAMISRIERGEGGATLGTLEKISIGLGVLLPELFGRESYAEPRLHRRNPVVSRQGQPECVDPVSGYRRRTLTPATAARGMQLSEVRLPAGAHVVFDSAGCGPRAALQIWMLDGMVELLLGPELKQGQARATAERRASRCDITLLEAGDCLAMELGFLMTARNPGIADARYLCAVIDSPPAQH
jgi:transcriptional regulator with XRE-family HTH domain